MHTTAHPPGPRSQFPLQHVWAFRRDGIGFLQTLAQKYGDIVQCNIGPVRTLLLNHPDYIKEVLTVQHRNFVKGRPLKLAKHLLGEGLLTSEGDFHKLHSRIIQPAFHKKMIDSYVPTVTNCIVEWMNGWKDDSRVNMMDEMMKLSLAIAGKTMFRADIARLAPVILQAFTTASALFARVAVPFAETLLHLPLPGTIRFYKAKEVLENVIRQMINEHRHNGAGEDATDLLSILLQSQSAMDAGEEGMSDQQVLEEALTLFVTAFDTTSTALTWTWYLLSQSPAVAADLKAEIDRVLQGRLPTPADLAQLPFTRKVFAESMRLYPPSYIIARQALDDFTIAQYSIARGTLVLMSPYLIHHDARFHPDPDAFHPHAWEPARGQQSKYTYFPFGGGPRSCIGEPFAWMQGVLVLATIAQSWQIKMVPNHPVGLLQLINLRPKGGMMMTLHRWQ